MKNCHLRIASLCILFFCNSAFSYTDHTIVGKWILQEPLNECPDVLVFLDNGTYSILNDCYGTEPKKPIVENGEWVTEDSTDFILVLNNRKITNQYSHWGSDPKQMLYVAWLSHDNMKLCKNNFLKGCECEIFYRRE